MRVSVCDYEIYLAAPLSLTDANAVNTPSNGEEVWNLPRKLQKYNRPSPCDKPGSNKK